MMDARVDVDFIRHVVREGQRKASVATSDDEAEAEDKEDLVELAMCGVKTCHDQRIDTGRAIRLHLGKAHGIFVKADAWHKRLRTIWAKASALTLTDEQEVLDAKAAEVDPNAPPPVFVAPPPETHQQRMRRIMGHVPSDDSDSD